MGGGRWGVSVGNIKSLGPQRGAKAMSWSSSLVENDRHLLGLSRRTVNNANGLGEKKAGRTHYLLREYTLGIQSI